jgi:hypothetical protein
METSWIAQPRFGAGSMSTRTANFDRSYTAPQAWSLTSAPSRLWSTLLLIHEAYGEALELARAAQRRGIFVE